MHDYIHTVQSLLKSLAFHNTVGRTILSKMFLKSVLLATYALTSTTLAAFGVTNSGGNYVIDAGSDNPFVITVNGNNCDIQSIRYRSEEFQYSKQFTQISSGLGSATVKAETISGKRI
jgi:rhamnogalacturonan endolyase